jgi:hypothetical protein
MNDEAENLRIARIASLTIANALVFQEVLASIRLSGLRQVRSIRLCLSEHSPIDSILEEWQYILDHVNYVPIFAIAREMLASIASGPRLERGVRRLADAALAITARRAALRHDLMGRVYHRLLSDAKYFGAFYTMIPSATLLLKLAMSEKWPTEWSNLEQIRDLRIADLACGTGTLLKAALQAIEDNYIKACAAANVHPSLPDLHKVLIENTLYGFDVLPFAVHMSASALAFHEPEVPFLHMELQQVPLGGPDQTLGSLEMDGSGRLFAQDILSGGTRGPERVTGAGVTRGPVTVPKLDLCVMNPPFTRSVGGNLLFGSLPKAERTVLQKKLRDRVRTMELQANITAGLGSVFVALADRRVKEKGYMALVLPRGVLIGSAWEPTRNLLTRGLLTSNGSRIQGSFGYSLRYVVVCHEPWAWNFSEKTKLSECLLVARKLTEKEDAENCTFVNLWHRPRSFHEALMLVDLIRGTEAPLLTSQGVSELAAGERKFGEVLQTPNAELQSRPWIFETAFAQTDMCRASYNLWRGGLFLPDRGTVGNFPVISLEQAGLDLGPDIRDIRDGFKESPSRTSYPALWGHKEDQIKTISQTPNVFLSPRAHAMKGRHLRDANLLWSRAGRLMIAERLWFKTQRLAAVLLPRPALASSWWPVHLSPPKGVRTQDAERIIALWLNSTLGIIPLVATRLETKGPWVKYKKPTLKPMPIIDITKLSSKQVRLLLTAYGQLQHKELKSFSEINDDRARAEVDSAITGALGLPSVSDLREMLVREPIMSLSQEH